MADRNAISGSNTFPFYFFVLAVPPQTLPYSWAYGLSPMGSGTSALWIVRASVGHYLQPENLPRVLAFAENRHTAPTSECFYVMDPARINNRARVFQEINGLP